jgi:hypothetical protein
MRDALRAVALVVGVLSIITGGVGLLRGQTTTVSTIAVIFGVVFLLAVVIIPSGKPPPAPHDDW